MSRTAVQRPATLETLTYAHAIKVALRRCGLLLKAPDRDRAAALVLPPDSVFESYEVALGKLLKQFEPLKQYSVARIVIDKRERTYAAEAVLEVSRGEGVIVLVEHGAVIPQEILLAVDRVVDVGPVKPRHLVAAAKEAWGMDITPDDARTLCSHPARHLFLAMRRGRPVDAVLRKLYEAAAPVTGAWEPRIEELEGYGLAKDWALDVIQDLTAWKEGNLRWRDVDGGLLLSGPPGTGKTLFASALARSCGATFMPTSSAKWQSRGHLGDMLGAMRATFKAAIDQAPTVLFIDEIDAIGNRKKFRGDNADYSVQVVNALLELLDGSDDREGVVVVAASNFPENVDPALRRPGRLDRHVEIELPDRAAREQMLSLHLEDEIPREDLKEIAVALGGYTGAHIEQLVRDARRIARRAGREVDAIDLINLVPPMLPLRGGERHSVCLHEAGHAVVGLALEIGVIEMIVVAQETGNRDDSSGHVKWIKPRVHNRSRNSYLGEICMLLAGMAAERVYLGTEFDGSGGPVGSDIQRAVDLATLMFANLGLEALQYHDVTTAADLDELRRSDLALRQRVERLLEQQLARAKRIIRERDAAMNTLVALMMEREVVLGREVQQLFLDNPAKASAA
ncbi:MAG: AAA family ATPase [Hydrogenophaga sp.]|nr:AAA family ATPase [Hydrogenophaga sp.]